MVYLVSAWALDDCTGVRGLRAQGRGPLLLVVRGSGGVLVELPVIPALASPTQGRGFTISTLVLALQAMNHTLPARNVFIDTYLRCMLTKFSPVP